MNDRTCGSRSRLIALALLAGASAGLAGCGGDDATPSTSSTPQAASPAASAPGPTSVNSAPTIAGGAAASVQVNAAYSFTPQAADADGDALTFQIQNKPAWATFDTLTGRLSGTPSVAQAGAYGGIVISASDGEASASLPPFSITVLAPVVDGATIVWSAPTQNVDGSTLADLAGFLIVYGPSSTMLHQSVRIANPSVDRYTFDQLAPGPYYFAVRAYTASGAESALSDVVSKVIQ